MILQSFSAFNFSDCTCCYHHDDGSGWFKGRAGTSAYWCPQMLDRDEKGERIAYGADADWYSMGCTSERHRRDRGICDTLAIVRLLPSCDTLSLALSLHQYLYTLESTVFALFTGRSPFSSGLGASHDAALTLDGTIDWPTGIFSKEGRSHNDYLKPFLSYCKRYIFLTSAKSLISGLLHRNASSRLGSRSTGWRDVMNHPFFARIDWGWVS